MTENLDNQDDEIYKSCPNCGKLIKWEAVICPYCNSPYPEVEFQELRGGMMHPVFSNKNSQTPYNKKLFLIILIILISAAILFALIFTFFSFPTRSINTAATNIGMTTILTESTYVPTTIAAETSTSHEATTTTKSAYIFSVGDLIDFRGATIIVTKFEKSLGDNLEKFKEEMEYIIVNVKIINQTGSKITFNPLDFKMQDSKGQVSNTIESYTTLETGELVTGAEVEETVVFEETKNDPELILMYQPDFFNDKDIIKISIK